MAANPAPPTVAIVGAGPTGLLLAGDLAAAGIDVTVLERRTHESNLSRAFVVHARTMELLDARGLAEELVATGTPLARLRLFGGIQIDMSRLPSRFPFVLVTPQYNVERILENRAVTAGARIIKGAELRTLRQDTDRVELDIHTDGETTTTTITTRADYVVGTDGVHSTVRDAVGLPFPGTSVLRSIMLADVRLTDAPRDVVMANGVGDYFAFIAPFGDGWHRIFAWNRHRQLPDSAPVDIEEIREVARRAFGTDFGLQEARWVSRFHSDERQVPRYRVDRVFLAGDAAHVHSPAGGQGMNTGLQDAANLSWKLAAVIQGWAPDGLLDTYQTERHPVGKTVLRSSGALIRAALVRPRAGRMFRNVLGALLLRLPPIVRAMAGTISGIGIDYPGAPRAGDVELRDGQRLYTVLREGRYVLLAPPPVSLTTSGWSDRLRLATPVNRGVPPTLVRPDGHVAWRGPESDLSAALARHLGTRLPV
ncbi:FAD-dependent monooxygenase [Micromonospora polyrhachis]|uniref:2-polyprenyl-6-methoxyphenol hydroxylase-like FAD-dependent oxidoreductase n=1 Tax=Micromonospora polyrhachis TaxID=1282883 RepID=A0A7W7WSG1_9ACTN|nr:FAD-dependent monooxygenase [Micromonospora polyrhachis]MBB4961368.1 2-polyprenyl-6-methoxyphenol hydroxylase-like FAD-dependent oxidoreductase [Micromonospora polyrhachis]